MEKVTRIGAVEVQQNTTQIHTGYVWNLYPDTIYAFGGVLFPDTDTYR